MKNEIIKILKRISILGDSIYHLLTVISVLGKGKRTHFKADNSGRKILIMGNAPSLGNTDIESLLKQDLDVVCVNWYPMKNEAFFDIKPRYLCLIDSLFYRQKDNEQVQALRDVLQRVDWKFTIISTIGNTLPIHNDNIDYVWLNENPHRGHGLKYYWYQKNLSNPGMQNVVLGALYYFIATKAQEILLAGVEISDFVQLCVDVDNDIYIETRHNYGARKLSLIDIGQVKKGEFYRALGFYQKMFEQFHEVAAYAEHQGVKIYNLTPNSYVDVFEKKTEYWKESC